MNRQRHQSALRQLTMCLDNRAIELLEASERADAISLIAQLLLEACGVASAEDDDEDV